MLSHGTSLIDYEWIEIQIESISSLFASSKFFNTFEGMIPVLVFDLDNTLIMRDQAMIRCIEDQFRKELSQFQNTLILEKDNHGHSDRIKFTSWLKDFLDLSESAHNIWNIISKSIFKYTYLNPGITDLMGVIDSRFKLAILTNGGIQNQQSKIQFFNLNQYFEQNHIFISQAIGYDKPDQRAFQKVEQVIGKDHNYLMIGDHFKNDIQPASELGWQTFHIQHQDGSQIEDLLQLILSIDGRV
ncbi:MAG: HAD family hydrolase [Flavobacteriales bacterium]|nr:HAD family hydrolase [Flavobacteriales bacterium]